MFNLKDITEITDNYDQTYRVYTTKRDYIFKFYTDCVIELGSSKMINYVSESEETLEWLENLEWNIKRDCDDIIIHQFFRIQPYFQ